MLPNETPVERNERLFNSPHPVAFVTGSAAPRVGRRIAQYFLSHGFRLVFHTHQATAAAEEFVAGINRAGQSAMLVIGEVQNETNVSAWLTETLDRMGRIDVLVNSAAVWDPKPLELTHAVDYEHFFQVNTLGTALCGQLFGLAMAQQASGGAIINIGDWAVARPYRDFAAYFSSKASIVGLTQSLAVELAQRNPRVRVNAVLPGPIQLAEGISIERQQKIVDSCLLKRAGSADDLAQAVLFLATSPFITGIGLPVDGGRSIWAIDASDAVAHPRCV